MEEIVDLGGGITAEITDTGGLGVCVVDNGVWPMGDRFGGVIAKMPVLAEKAVEGAGMDENSQVCISFFRAGSIGIVRIAGISSGRTDPVSHAVCGKGVVVEREIPILFFPISEPAVEVLADSAVTAASIRDLALVDAVRALSPVGITRRGWRQFEGFADFGVDVVDMFFYLVVVSADTVNTDFKRRGDEKRVTSTPNTSCHISPEKLSSYNTDIKCWQGHWGLFRGSDHSNSTIINNITLYFA